MSLLAAILTPKVGGRPIRVASEPYTHPTAPGPFLDRILRGSRLRREIFADGRTFGAASADYGTLQLANVDGWLDWLETDGVDAYGGAVEFFLLPSVTAPWSSRKPLFSGRLGQPQIGDTADMRLLDDFALALDKQIGAKRFAGTNSGPTGLEGGDDLKDKWYPVLEGRAYRCPVPWATTAALILCLADKAVAAIQVDAVDDQGAPITRGVRRNTLAELQATAPAPGRWDYFLGDPVTPAYIRLGSSPAGTIAVTLRSGGTAADRTAAQVWRRVLTSRAGVAESAIAAGDIATLDQQAAAEVGFWVGPEGATIRQQLDFVAESVGAGYWQDRSGLWRIARIDLPAGPPACRFRPIGEGAPGAVGDFDILKLEPVFTGRSDGGRPFDMTRMKYARNHSPANKDSLAGVALDQAERLTKEYLDTAYPAGVVAPENEYIAETAFAELSAAAAEAQRRHAIGGSRRRRHLISTIMSPALTDRLDLNSVVSVDHPRYGFAGGRLTRVSAIEVDLLTLETELTVWS